jgi:hypothetical protein
LTDPANVTWMIPAHEQLQVDPTVKAGMFPIKVLAAPGAHGVVTGTHGIGVSTPRAAVVAVATVGLARLMHIPNGAMLTIGALSMIDPAGMPSIITLAMGSTVSVDGAIPNEHSIIAVETMFGGMSGSSTSSNP